VRPAMLLATIGFAGLCCAADEAKVKPGSAQPATGSNIHLRAGPQGSKELFDAIAAKDRQLFAVVFDTCDAAAARKMVVDDFEFFHDKDGLSETSGAKFAEDIGQHCERIKTGVDFRARRELVEGSMAVYPLNNYGAVETGRHRFYAIADGKPDQLTETAQFLHVWKNDQGEWKLARVVSYDHQLAETGKH